MKKHNLINPERKPLTPEKLRELSGLTQLSDEQAEKMVQSINLLVKILYDSVKAKESICIDNQQVVYLQDNTEPINNAA